MILNFREQFLKTLLFCILSLFCYLYTFYGSDFAEWTIRLDFLNFPIFIGESLLFIVLLLCALYYLKFPKRLNKKLAIAMALYVAWILLKAIPGYFQSGPLALRNAALFYYPFFVFAAYTMFDRGIYRGVLSKAFLLFLLLNLFFAPINDYFVPAYWLLALGFSLTLRPLWFSGIAILLLATHVFYTKFLFVGSRSHMIGIGLMVSVLVGYFILGFLKIAWRTKLFAVGGAAILVLLGLAVFGDQNALRSMLTFRHLREQYAILDEDIQKKKKYYVQPELQPCIYLQNKDNHLTKNLFGYSYVPSGNPTPEEVQAMHDSARDFMQRATELKESVIYERADEIYQKTRAILEQQNSKIIKQAERDLDKELKELIVKSDGQVEKDLEEALQNLSLALHRQADHSVDELKKSVDDASQNTIAKLKENVRQKQEQIVANILTQKADRSLEVAYNNIFFRLFIWRDMIEELKTKSAWWGVGFGHPQRSVSIEILDWASVEWRRDGWITPHNSFLHMIYRGGVLGVVYVLIILATVVYLVIGFLKHRSVWGGLLVASLMYWIGISNFLVFLELPHTAIPFWTFLGMTIAYYHSLERGKNPHA